MSITVSQATHSSFSSQKEKANKLQGQTECLTVYLLNQKNWTNLPDIARTHWLGPRPFELHDATVMHLCPRHDQIIWLKQLHRHGVYTLARSTTIVRLMNESLCPDTTENWFVIEQFTLQYHPWSSTTIILKIKILVSKKEMKIIPAKCPW